MIVNWRLCRRSTFERSPISMMCRSITMARWWLFAVGLIVHVIMHTFRAPACALLRTCAKLQELNKYAYNPSTDLMREYILCLMETFCSVHDIAWFIYSTDRTLFVRNLAALTRNYRKLERIRNVQLFSKYIYDRYDSSLPVLKLHRIVCPVPPSRISAD